MILYSIIPAEVVFQGSDNFEDVKYFEADYRGERIQAAQMSDKHYEITRLLSTNPRSFLDPSLQPGNVIDVSKMKIIE